MCEEDTYLLELVRYIHLNPLRASLVQNLQELDKYPWTGHSAIIGRRKNPLIPEVSDQKSEVSSQKTPRAPSVADGLPFSLSSGKGKKQQNNPDNPVNPVKEKKLLAEKTIEDTLLHFAETKRAAIKKYREFVEKGIKQGTREDLQGGGLVRSAGGDAAGLLGRKAEEREKGDARILGSGDFVETTLHQSEKLLERKYGPKKAIEDLIKDVSEVFGVSPELICSGSRKPKISDARAIVAHMAVEETDHKATDVAKHLGIKQTSVLQSVKKGKVLCNRVGL